MTDSAPGAGATVGAAAIEAEDYAAVLDTNVIIDIHSVHNITEAEPERRAMRFDRARDALLLGICLHETRATTYSAREVTTKLPELVVPKSGTFEEQHTIALVHFVVPELLSRWRAVFEKDDDTTGTRTDRFLAEMAVKLNRPLITTDGGLSRRARKLGATVFSPGEYWLGRMDREGAQQSFLRRFRAQARPCAKRMQTPGTWEQLLDMVFDYYVYLLLGRRQ